MYTPRTLEIFLAKSSAQFPIVLLTGARQVGKSTLLQHLSSPGRKIVSLDDPLVLELANNDPAYFMQRFPAPVLIDEIQYAPRILPYIKMAVDNQRRPGGYWLTGSQQFHLMKGISESLAGRVAIVSLLGMSRRECLKQSRTVVPFLPTPRVLARRRKGISPLKLKDLYKNIWRGGFPAMALSAKTDRDLFFSSYVQTYLQRDVRDLARLGDELSFLRFLRVAAARSGQLLNLAEMARDADIAPNTAKSWMSILQSSGIIYLLEPYYSNLTKRLVKAPKLYFLDTGLGAWLTEWSNPQVLEAGAASGAMLETWVMGELLKSYWHNGRRAPFYYYRDKDQKEIDLLIVQDGTIYPLEIKKSATPSKEAVRHFSLLEKYKLPVGAGGVICLAEESLPLGSNVVSIPIGEL